MIHGHAYSRDGNFSVVTLPSGHRVPSVPHPTDEYTQRARELGYPSGAAMSAEHDLIHVHLAAVFGTTSPTLEALALGDEKPNSWMEEDLVKLVAARLNRPGDDEQPGGGFIRWLRGEMAKLGTRAMEPRS